MALPPDLCGFAPVPAPMRDRRWLAIKDAGIPGLGYRTSPIAKVQAWVQYALRYVPEQVDRWSPPAETFERRSGDCEDFALLKRALLLNSGIPDEDILFVLARDLVVRVDHAFLVVRSPEGWVVLDSRAVAPIPVARLRDYVPIVAFTGATAFTFGRRR